jgi:hypothetical protein
VLQHERDRFTDIAVEEPEAKNLLSRDHHMNVEPAYGRRGSAPTSSMERPISNPIGSAF